MLKVWIKKSLWKATSTNSGQSLLIGVIQFPLSDIIFFFTIWPWHPFGLYSFTCFLFPRSLWLHNYTITFGLGRTFSNWSTTQEKVLHEDGGLLWYDCVAQTVLQENYLFKESFETTWFLIPFLTSITTSYARLIVLLRVFLLFYLAYKANKLLIHFINIYWVLTMCWTLY